MKRLKRQISLRVASCIFIAIKFKFRRNPCEISDFLYVLKKYDYYCTESRFKKAELRVLREIEFNLKFVTLLDVVLYLQMVLKNNIDLELEFYFPSIYDLIDLIYFNEFEINAEESKVNHPRDLVNYACLVLSLIPLLINHEKSMKVNLKFFII